MIAKGDAAITRPDPVDTPTTSLTGPRPVSPSIKAPDPTALQGY